MLKNQISRIVYRVAGIMLILLVVMSAGLFDHPPPGAIAAGNAVDFAGGTGTVGDPYLVANAGHLDNVRNHLGAHFLQTADINLGVAPWNQGAGWVPIGISTSGNRFAGSYDGGGYAIRNMTINRTATDYQGLFGYAQGATIRNVHLKDVTVQGRTYVGGLVGYASQSSMIENASVTGVLASSSATGFSYLGGLVGYADSLTILHFVNAAVDVQGTRYTGGLVGYNTGTIRHAHSQGNVQGTNEVGGLVGYMSHAQAVITDCYSWAAVSGTDDVGGLVGRYAFSPVIYRSYSAGAVTGTGANVGGLLGSRASPTDGVISQSYWDVNTSGQATSAGGTGKTTIEMKQQSTYRYYNFFKLWKIEDGTTYPTFQDLSTYPPLQHVDLGDLVGSGTEGNPYLIYNAHQLNAIRQDLEVHYRLVEDIDLSPSVAWNMGAGWERVGTNSLPFKGVFHGGGHTIQHLAISQPKTMYQGLFGYIQNATVQNVRLQDSNVLSGSYSGILVGYAHSNNSITSVSTTGQIMSVSSYIGGLLGYYGGVILSNASAVVDVLGETQVGGLVGYNFSSEITRSYAAGAVRGTSRVGGLVGYMSHAQGRVFDSYSRASVNGGNLVGGLVGQYQFGCEIHRSYSTGQVVGTGENVGGLLGGRFSDTDGAVVFSYWDVQTSGQAGSAGGEGRTTAQMTHPYGGSTYVGWDFDSVWVNDTSLRTSIGLRNDGYPYLTGVTPPKVTIALSAAPFGSGLVDGAGTYLYGTMLTARATPGMGWEFLYWKEGDLIVSVNSSYTFSAVRDRNLTAHFQEKVYNPDGIISGTVTQPNSTPAAGIQVILYRALDGGGWQVVGRTMTNAVGNYAFSGLAPGPLKDYRAQFVDPNAQLVMQYYQGPTTLEDSWPIIITPGVPRVNINVVMVPYAAPLVDVDAGTGSVFYGGDGHAHILLPGPDDVTITYAPTCPGGVTPTAVELIMTPPGTGYPMTHLGGGQYQGTIPAGAVTGAANLQVALTCNGYTTYTTIGWLMLFDPSGYITDAESGEAVPGALVTLFHVPGWEPKNAPGDSRPDTCESHLSKAPGAPWSQPAPVHLGIVVNPELTAIDPILPYQHTTANGYYGWDVSLGCWYVTVAAEGYEPLVSPVVGVPPEVTDLDLALMPVPEDFKLYLPLIMR